MLIASAASAATGPSQSPKRANGVGRAREQRHRRDQRARARAPASVRGDLAGRRDGGRDAGRRGAQLRAARLDAAERRRRRGAGAARAPTANQESFESVTISSAPSRTAARASAGSSAS